MPADFEAHWPRSSGTDDQVSKSCCCTFSSFPTDRPSSRSPTPLVWQQHVKRSASHMTTHSKRALVADAALLPLQAALADLQAEAAKVGANGLVDVKFEINQNTLGNMVSL